MFKLESRESGSAFRPFVYLTLLMIQKAIKKSTTAQVDAVLKDVPKIIEAFESALSTHFAAASPSELENAYATTLKSSPDAVNTPLVSALSAYKDLLAQTIDNIQLFERFIVLHIPQMEDGNNFGVTGEF